MSKTKDDADRLSYTINCAQQGVAEPGNPTFQIFTESLRSSDPSVLFDRDNPDASPLKHALNYVENDNGILAAVRKAELDGHSDGYQTVSDCAKEIGRFNRFRLSPHELGRPSRLPEITGDPISAPRLGYEGEGLAACLYYMQETKDPALTKIIEEVNAVLPDFDGFEFNVFRRGQSRLFDEIHGRPRTHKLGPHVTRQPAFLGLILTYSANRPPVMLLEEPENGLTPAAIEHFYAAVRALAFREDATQRSQILISSHSPFVMCEAWNGEDQDFIHQVKIENGQCVIRNLSEVIALNAGPLGKDKSGERTILSLRNAAELMSGYLQ